MNKQVYTAAALVLGGLVVGATVEHIRVSGSAVDVNSEEPDVIHHVQKVARNSTKKSDDMNSALIASLKKTLAEKDSEIKTLRAEIQMSTEPVVVEKKERKDGERKHEGWSERIERMKTEEPEKYAEMQQRRDDFKARMTQRSTEGREFLAAIDTANMNEEQLANHTRLVELTDKLDGMMQQMFSGEGGSSHEERREMFSSIGELGDLYASEREYLLQETATAVGYQGEEAALFTEHVSDIIEKTTLRPMMGGRRRGR